MIDIPCYVGINSSGKKACTFLLSSSGLMAGHSYRTFFLQLFPQVSPTLLRINSLVNVAPRICDFILTLPCNTSSSFFDVYFSLAKFTCVRFKSSTG